MQIHRIEKEFLGRKLVLETGKLAKFATGSIQVSYGDTSILVTTTIAKEPRPGMDFFPLLVDYQEKFYATGKMKGSRFIKREGRPSDGSILAARMIDRPLRPLFPKNTRNDVQVVVNVLQADMVNNPEDIAILGASLACSLTGAPFGGPCAGVRVGLVMKEDGTEEIVVNPNYEQVENGRLDLMVAGTANAITMIEAGAKEVDSDLFLKALEKAHEKIKELCAIQKEFLSAITDIKPIELIIIDVPAEVVKEVGDFVSESKVKGIFGKGKDDADLAQKAIMKETLEHFAPKYTDKTEGNIWTEKDVKKVVYDQIQYHMRKLVLREGVRVDGRKLDEIRPIAVEHGLFPRVHGSGLFTRGETQVLSMLTLGSPGDAMVVDDMDEATEKRYLHHYNFPAFSVGEVAPNRGPGRREIGHGDLAERALLAVLPTKEAFPYTIRVVSEVLMSNGSSSMASVCGSTLALMDAGVPISAPVSGIAMGLILDKDTKEHCILFDIQGLEDFLGDMDFKVAGTDKGITSLQLDIKIEGLTSEILKDAIAKADKGRKHILDTMTAVLSAPLKEMSQYAPRIESMMIPVASIGEVIGPGGKMIRSIVAATNAKIDIDDNGLVMVTGTDAKGVMEAVAMIKALTYMPQVGDEFEGKVTRILGFGALVEYAPGKEGLLHISEIAPMRINAVEDVLKLGDRIKVKVKALEGEGKVSLTHKQFFEMPAA